MTEVQASMAGKAASAATVAADVAFAKGSLVAAVHELSTMAAAPTVEAAAAMGLVAWAKAVAKAATQAACGGMVAVAVEGAAARAAVRHADSQKILSLRRHCSTPR